ncbi:LysR family transcriptional regulator [Companilactobacillus sp.]|uniref:LysR family transcriptional regulator n=1 Tax=Companilactobacillus sp. TaxID=2767905 RepID=UPI0025BF3CD8|nr:LysR family transcriptional regulator [Companilactobacillus sp.]MCH4009981.1 LysR family transcriptional regulator [Companilactobacillus sp.]MCH4052343.1 LysR family transcriptional regulator [Companilactobacillus sp.]MCH4077923.1 LysR family transcriptional regulator [Companilactobacillus sp.]MCH4126499.1 LysR family transcriptional regulator [Companilactobacillus sp.]MCH4132085.1 LysR family transcriptional regulator [Companilactobacillus sp.]
MNTKDLDYFRTLVEKRNYTEVAEIFNVSQPTITQAIKRLEKEFETKLVNVDRVHQKTEITRTGYLLFEKSLAIQKNLDLAHKEIKAADSQKIKFGLPPIIGTLYFPQVVGKIAQNDLLDKLQIFESGSNALFKQLADGDIDVAVIGSLLPINNPNFQVTQLGSRPFSLIVSSQHPLAQSKQAVDFKDLVDEKFIDFAGQFIHGRILHDYFEHTGINPEIIQKTPDISWYKSLVRANIGIGVLVRDEINKYDDNITCLEIKNPIPENFNVSIVYRSSYILKPEEEQLIDILKTINVENISSDHY